MIDPNDLQLAWKIYLGLGAVAVLLWILLLNGLKSGGLRVWLALAAVAFLFTPVEHGEVAGAWVPANTAAALSLMSRGVEAAIPALVALGASQGLALLLALIYVLISRRGRGAESASAAGEDMRTEPTVDVIPAANTKS